MGLVIKPVQPASIAISLSESNAYAVCMIIGMSADNFRISFNASIPFISGIFISKRMRSTELFRYNSIASFPFFAHKMRHLLPIIVFNKRKLLSISSAINSVVSWD